MTKISDKINFFLNKKVLIKKATFHLYKHAAAHIQGQPKTIFKIVSCPVVAHKKTQNRKQPFFNFPISSHVQWKATAGKALLKQQATHFVWKWTRLQSRVWFAINFCFYECLVLSSSSSSAVSSASSTSYVFVVSSFLSFLAFLFFFIIIPCHGCRFCVLLRIVFSIRMLIHRQNLVQCSAPSACPFSSRWEDFFAKLGRNYRRWIRRLEQPIKLRSN